MMFNLMLFTAGIAAGIMFADSVLYWVEERYALRGVVLFWMKAVMIVFMCLVGGLLV